ncbi:aminotransferase-like domain-containing protein [Halotalea alkalilenta]|uniref:GntR family transcriptional regulator n=1 Tax=Halotalea alkalilenta TaxID=376489 RepID=A0A172YIY0_9GAMM|nr:PLP-dependent aminotransferase family protein [Halotalea alkalilenta]ANF59178.1 GntR family transcriptional regulator [Halotalea alkalilenta]
MTIWTPLLAPDRPRYRALCEAIGKAIASGELRENDKLPPQRQLADRLGVTVGTVTRGYAEAERRGLVEARVGSGTYVSSSSLASRQQLLVPNAFEYAPSTIDLSHAHAPPHPERAAGLARAMERVRARAEMLEASISYQREQGLLEHRQCIAGFMGEIGLPVDAEELLLTQGGQHGIFVALAAMLRAGERAASCELTYPGFQGAARQLGIKALGVGEDAQGIDVAALERLHAQQPLKLIYVMPDQHNPTGRWMSEARRCHLVEAARRHDWWLLEDGVLYLPQALRGSPLYRLAPERTLYLFSFSKIFGGGLRQGVMRMPDQAAIRLRGALRAQSWMTPPLMSALVCAWIESGDAARMLEWQNAELEARYDLALERLAGYSPRGQRGSTFLWLTLPLDQRAGPLLERLAAERILFTPSEPFCIGHSPAPQAVRLCLGAARDRETLAHALDRLVAQLETPQELPLEPL